MSSPLRPPYRVTHPVPVVLSHLQVYLATWSSTLVQTTDSLRTAIQKHSHSPALIDISRREHYSMHTHSRRHVPPICALRHSFVAKGMAAQLPGCMTRPCQHLRPKGMAPPRRGTRVGEHDGSIGIGVLTFRGVRTIEAWAARYGPGRGGLGLTIRQLVSKLSCSMVHFSTSQLVGRMNARRAGEGRGGLGLTCGSSSANILLDQTLLHITTGGSHECAEGRGFA